MSEKAVLFIGTYTQPILHGTGNVLVGRGQGIYHVELDIETGRFSDSRLVIGTPNPSYLCLSPCGRYLYAVNELKEYDGKAQGSVSAFALDGERAVLINTKPTGGTDPCHVAVSHDGKLLVVSNFMSGSICAYAIGDDGALCGEGQFFQHEGAGKDPLRQSGPHAHAAVFDPTDRFVHVPDLGVDEIKTYRYDHAAGKLEFHASYRAAAGSGPRYCEFHPFNGLCYSINELGCTIDVLTWDAQTGKLDRLDTVSTVSPDYEGKTICAALRITPDGRYVYGSNRGHDSIAAFSVQPDGRLKSGGFFPSGGKTPRDFTINSTGRYLIAANQDSDIVTAFVIDPDSGRLRLTDELRIPTPVCVLGHGKIDR